MPFQRLLYCAFAPTSSSYFLRDFLRPPGSGVLRRSCSLFFFFECFYRPSKLLESRPFFFLGVEVWVGPSVFSPALGSVDSSLGSGKIRSSVFAWAVSCSTSFFLCMWFRQNIGVSSLRRSLWWSAGCSDPGIFCSCCSTFSLPCRSLWPISLWALGRGFFIVFLSSACGVLFTAFFRQLAAIGVLFVMSSTDCCLNGSVLCSSSSQLSFSFPANVCWGPGGVPPFGPLRVLIRFLRLFCSFLSTFVFSFPYLTFSVTAESYF